MTDNAIADGCFEKIENAIAMLEKAACDIKLIQTQFQKDEVTLSVAITTTCGILTSAMAEISLPEMLKLAACATHNEGWGQ